MDYSKLPDDINMEILSRTSLKAFDAICSTTKQIRNLKYDPYFLHLYKRKTNIVSGFLVQTINGFHEFAPSKDSTALDLGFLSTDDRILAASEKGIIVFETPNPTHYGQKLIRVCKPTNNQVFELPINPKAKNVTENVAIMVMGSNPFRYKIMRLSQPNHSYSQRLDEPCNKYCCEIFDSAILSWKLLDDIKLPYNVFVISSQPITIGGSAYLLLSSYDVLKFDFYSEKWRLIPTPADNSFESLKLVTYKGKLALECKPTNGRCREIWVGSIDETWKKTFVFDEKEDRERMHLYSFYDSDTSVFVDYDTLVFYKFKKDDSFSKVVLSDIIAKIFAFRSDFEPIDIASPGNCLGML